MNIEHSWKIVEITTTQMHIMVSSVKLELTSVLGKFAVKDIINIPLPKNFSQSMVPFESVTEEMCLKWAEDHGKPRKQGLLSSNELKLKNMHDAYYTKFIRTYTNDEFPWNKAA
jgi:hypothetical protein